MLAQAENARGDLEAGTQLLEVHRLGTGMCINWRSLHASAPSAETVTSWPIPFSAALRVRRVTASSSAMRTCMSTRA